MKELLEGKGDTDVNMKDAGLKARVSSMARQLCTVSVSFVAELDPPYVGM